MKTYRFVFVCFLFLASGSFAGTLESARMNFSKAAESEIISSKMIKELAANHDTPELLAYYGAYNTIWANHVFNPTIKLSYFIKGSKQIEQAVIASAKSIVVRFIRLSIQKNCPSFLGYSGNIKEDTDFIKSHKSEITSTVLKKMVDDILKN